MNVIGPVKDKTCIIIDDLVDTAGTICEAARALKDKGAISWWLIAPTVCFRIMQFKLLNRLVWMNW